MTFAVTVNGETQTADPGTTVARLARDLGLDLTTIAVERNREIVPRADYHTTTLAAGDVLEIVTFVGGG